MQSIILKGDDQRVQELNVQDLTGRTKPRSHAAAAGAPCQTRIEVLRVGPTVRGIEVHCSCGEITVVELTYPQE